MDVYRLPYNPKYPVVCFDEKNKQLISNVKKSKSAKSGHPAKVDYHYERNGTIDIFMFAEPFAGQRHIKLYDTETGMDFADAMRFLVEHFILIQKKSLLFLTI